MRAEYILAALLVPAPVLAPPALAQETPDQAQLARQLELAQPGPEHQRLAELAGEWEVTYSAQGMTFDGVAENRMILGGRFLHSSVTATFSGMQFEALTILGFDRGPGVYTVVGFDTEGTFYVTAAGPWDESAHQAALAGSYEDRVTGHAHDYEFVWRMDPPDGYSWEVVFLDHGERSTVVTADYRRR